MKSAIKLLCIAELLCIPFLSQAQILKNIGNRVKQKVEQRTDQKVDKSIDKGLDKTEDAGKKKDSSLKTDSNKSTNQAETGNQNKTIGATEQVAFETYSKFDFIPGDKVIAYDDFSQDAIGDFPANWNTNSSGEVVSSSIQPGHWLMVKKQGRFIPEYIKNLPDNFTFEYDVICNEKYSFYSPVLSLFFLTGNNGKEAFDYSFIPIEKRSGVRIGVHPTDAGARGGTTNTESFEDGASFMKNEVTTSQFNSNAGKIKLHVSVWRQKQRLRVYLNEEKAFDLPRAFPANKSYSTVLFEIWGNMNNDIDRYLIGSIKFSAGAPDTRNKLITEGKFVTRGILFDVNSDKIKPESFGTLKDIATVLTENPSVKV